MRDPLLRRSRHAAAFLACAVLLSGCSDDPAAPEFSGESASNTAAAAARVVAPIENSQDVADNLFVAILSLINLSASPNPVLAQAALPFQAAAASDLGSAIGLARSLPVPAPSQAMAGILIPSEYEGSTLVYDVELGQYVVDELATGAPASTQYQRSDVCAVPAASVVGEAMVAWTLADALLEKSGGDSLGEVLRNLRCASR